jgi:hypothetical protein
MSASHTSRSAVADALHSAAIHLLRGVRKEDEGNGVGPARLSALSVCGEGVMSRMGGPSASALQALTVDELDVLARVAAIVERVSATI